MYWIETCISMAMAWLIISNSSFEAKKSSSTFGYEWRFKNLTRKV